MKKILIILIFMLGYSSICFAQRNSVGYWQQHVDYVMEVAMDVETFNYTGTQKIVYTNNAPDTLNKVFFHLYFNAFQPGSEMDVRSQTITDPDSRVMNRIQNLSKEDQGYLVVRDLVQNGKKLNTRVVGTILEVDLNRPIAPGEQTTFEMAFEGQVPLIVRRSGKNSAEDVALSMAQF